MTQNHVFPILIMTISMIFYSNGFYIKSVRYLGAAQECGISKPGKLLGEATMFQESWVHEKTGACGFDKPLSSLAEGFFTAVGTEDWDEGFACGTCVELGYKGRKVVVNVVDRCGDCSKGWFDVGGPAWTELTGELPGHVHGVSSRWVECPSNITGGANIQIYVKPGSHAWDSRFQPVGNIMPVLGMFLDNGKGWMEMKKCENFMFCKPTGIVLGSNFKLRVTSTSKNIDVEVEGIPEGQYITTKDNNAAPQCSSTSKPEPTTSKPDSTTSKQEPTTSKQETTTSKPEPTTSKPEPTTSKSEPTTSKPEPTTSKPEPTTSKPERTTSKPERTTSKPEPTTSKPEPTTSKPEPTTSKPEPTTSKPEPTTSKPEPTTSKPEPTTSKPEPTTSKPEPSTSKPEPTTSEPEPTTSKPEPTTSKPEPTTSKPEPTTSKPEPSTSKPEPTTSKPEPTTSKPEPTIPSTSVDCSIMDGIFADPNNCRDFIQCAHGTTFQMACGAGTYFDEVIFNCNWPYNTDCGDRPIPYLP